ncbi:MAG TPA: PilZ domain-containing protein [Candidatus Acidoferrum sp.]
MDKSQPQAPRYAFSAPAELSRVGDSATEKVRVNEISLHGCYLDDSTSFSRGTQVTIKIFSGGQTVEATASILYSQPTLGTGLAFREVKPPVMAILREWLQQALDQRNAPPPSIDGVDPEQES